VTEPPPRQPLRDILRAYAQTDVPAAITLMRLAIESRSEAEFRMALDQAPALPCDERRSADLAAIAHANPNAWRIVRSVLSEVAHDSALAIGPETAIAHCAAAFDRAAHVSPEASVALYTFGDPDRLAAATTEVVAQMHAWRLLGPGRVLLEIGCGIGRFPAALAGEAAMIIGLDISGAMVDEARRRCSGLPNVEIRQSSGLDLAGVANASIDCVFAIDAFPYIMQIGTPLAAAHFREVARTLRPGGDFLIVNFSYRSGTDESDADDVRRLGAAAGLQAIELGERPFRAWDGRAFRLRTA
jgi:SAM-dependent methyltransferase